MKRLGDDGIRTLRDARTRPVRGAEKLRRIHPWDEPKTLAEAGGKRVPTYKLAIPGEEGHRLQIQCKHEVRAHRAAHETARQERLDGNFDAVFPYGTYQMRVLHRAPVADPDPDSLVHGPGPLLQEVPALLEDLRPARDSGELRDARHQMLDELRETLRDAAEPFIEDSDIDLEHLELDRFAAFRASSDDALPEPVTTESSDADVNSVGPLTPRPEPQVRHRFDSKSDRNDGVEHPRRLIIRRDDRRGRFRKPGGSDPPD